MNYSIKEGIYKNRPIKFYMVFFCTLFLFVLSFFGCSEQPSHPPVQAPKKPQTVTNKPAATQSEAVVVEETPEQEGYIYQQRNRRDPFAPLIVPKKKATKKEGVRPGSLASYDISDFTLAAIAQKGGRYLALLTTPDNRSFTVNKGTSIGLHKGKVQEITKDKIIIIEYSGDYRGELKPRKIILELHKGEVQ